jgi:hypothetical protein
MQIIKECRSIHRFDDDGEKLAARKILEILISNEDEGLICVARWYGRVMLGPARFDHIVHVAADALWQAVRDKSRIAFDWLRIGSTPRG